MYYCIYSAFHANIIIKDNNNIMPINHWPAEERPREKLLAKGAHTLTDAELLAIFIRTGIKGKTALDLSQELLKDYGNLRKIIHAQATQFCQKPGLGLAKYVQLQAALEIAKRNLEETLREGDALTDSAATKHYLTASLRDLQQEVFACLFLDNSHRIIEFCKLFYGTINSTVIYPREVVRQALQCNAAAVIFAHNHPSGIAKPSSADKLLTQKLKEALHLIDVRVLDHIIVGDGQLTSFAELGLL